MGSGIKWLGSGIRRAGSGITAPGSGITDHGFGISSFLGIGDQAVTIFVGSGTKIVHAFGIRDQKFACKNGISDEKTYLVTTLISILIFCKITFSQFRSSVRSWNICLFSSISTTRKKVTGNKTPSSPVLWKAQKGFHGH